MTVVSEIDKNDYYMVSIVSNTNIGSGHSGVFPNSWVCFHDDN